jgi:hypothetical protein
MSLFLANLDAPTRTLIASEIDADIANRNLYFGRRFSAAGERDYPQLIKDTALAHDDDWLAQQLRAGGRLNATEEKRKPNVGFTTARVPVTAAETFAEGEFNRFYIRGLCRRAIAEGVPRLVIYRAKAVANPRQDSEAKIGQMIDPAKLLADLRANPGVDTAFGLPNGPNSGLSVRLP